VGGGGAVTRRKLQCFVYIYLNCSGHTKSFWMSFNFKTFVELVWLVEILNHNAAWHVCIMLKLPLLQNGNYIVLVFSIDLLFCWKLSTNEMVFEFSRRYYSYFYKISLSLSLSLSCWNLLLKWMLNLLKRVVRKCFMSRIINA